MAELTKTRVSDASTNASPHSRTRALRQKLLGGSLTLLAGSSLVGVTNLVYNVLTARMLGPTGFAHATAVYTLLMLASAITLSFQVVCAKYVASHEDESEKNAIFARLHIQAWIAGTGIGLLLFLFNGTLQHYPQSARPRTDLVACTRDRILHPFGSAPRIHTGSPRLPRAGSQLHAGGSSPAWGRLSVDSARTGSPGSSARRA